MCHLAWEGLNTLVLTSYQGANDDIGSQSVSETCAAGESDKLSAQEVVQMTQIPELEKLTEGRTTLGQNCFQAWCEEGKLDKIELGPGSHVRLKTKGSGPSLGQ